ncbi:hypothetical protein, partial [Acinetobacter baumannii]
MLISFSYFGCCFCAWFCSGVVCFGCVFVFWFWLWVLLCCGLGGGLLGLGGFVGGVGLGVWWVGWGWVLGGLVLVFGGGGFF